jgi:hypothetical protein
MFFRSPYSDGVLKAFVYEGYHYVREITNIPQDLDSSPEKMLIFVSNEAAKDRLVARPNENFPLSFELSLF